MANESVAVAGVPAMGGNRCDLWFGGSGGEVLTITIDRHSKAFPPRWTHCQLLNDTIQGLVRATKAVAYQASNDSSADAEFLMQPIEDIADAIMILSQLSAAISAEAHT